MSKDLYDILGITVEERKLQGKEFEKVLKNKFKTAAKEWHPDSGKHPEDISEKRFKEIAEAKDVLGDPQKRQQYDLTGSTSDFNFNNFSDIDLNDILKEFMSNRGGFGGSFSQRERRYKGNDISLKISLNIEDVYTGITKKYKYSIDVPCKHCDGGTITHCTTCNGMGTITRTQQLGFGFVQNTSTCPTCKGIGKIITNNCKHCNGTGLEKEEKTIEVNIPRGITIGNSLIINGYGNHLPKAYKGEIGDLHIICNSIESNEYQIEGYDLILIKEIPIIDILTGCEVNVPLPNKQSTKLKINKNTKDSVKFRLVGKGLPKGNTIMNGDLYVFIKHKFPDNIRKDELKLLEKLKKCKNFI